MAFIVGENCIKCKFQDCVTVCPVDCFHVGPNMLVIDPAECIDCSVCVPECPADAIFAEEDLPKDQEEFIAINAELSKKWPVITKIGERPEDADIWNGVPDKRKLLDRGE
jgi:ferredoxin